MELSVQRGCPMIQDTRVPERKNSNGILHGRRWSVFDWTKDERHSLD